MNHSQQSSIQYRLSAIASSTAGESSYLRAYKALHLSRTLYKSTLFMQNKPNFRKSQMNVSYFYKMTYENKSNWTLGENKPNSNPISKQLVEAGPRRAESAKMALKVVNRGVITVQAESIKKPLKKSNLLKIKMLSFSHQPITTTGTSFAHLEYMR